MTHQNESGARVALRTRFALESAAAVVVVVAAGMAMRHWLESPDALTVARSTDTYAWKAAAIFAAAMTVAFAFLDEHPFSRFGAANQITMIRLMLVALIAALIGEPPVPAAAASAVMATVGVACLDGVDGWLARRTKMLSAFGARFDMETDALLIMALSILVWLHGKAGGWIVLGGLMRYAFIASGWMLPWMAGPLTPTWRAKAVAVTHMVGLAISLAPIVPLPMSTAVAALSLAVLTWSFGVDVGRLRRNRDASAP